MRPATGLIAVDKVDRVEFLLPPPTINQGNNRSLIKVKVCVKSLKSSLQSNYLII